MTEEERLIAEARVLLGASPDSVVFLDHYGPTTEGQGFDRPLLGRMASLTWNGITVLGVGADDRAAADDCLVLLRQHLNRRR